MIVLVPKLILVALRKASAEHHPLETGGFLIGLRRGANIDLTGITRQAKGDVATPSSFERAAASHREQIHRAWSASDATKTLVGDWHSHPNGSCNASSTDLRAWRKLARSLNRPVLGMIEFGADAPSLYLATKSTYWSAVRLMPFEEGWDYLAFKVAQ